MPVAVLLNLLEFLFPFPREWELNIIFLWGCFKDEKKNQYGKILSLRTWHIVNINKRGKTLIYLKNTFSHNILKAFWKTFSSIYTKSMTFHPTLFFFLIPREPNINHWFAKDSTPHKYLNIWWMIKLLLSIWLSRHCQNKLTKFLVQKFHKIEFGGHFKELGRNDKQSCMFSSCGYL